MNNKWL